MNVISTESVRSLIRASVANALAQAFIDGVDNAAQERRPLTLLQQQDMLVMAMYTAHSSMTEAEDKVDIEERFYRAMSND